MNKRKRLIITCFVVLSIVVIAVLIKKAIKPVVSYDESMLTDNINSFEIAAKTCMDYYKNNRDDNDVWLFNVDIDMNNLICYNNNEQAYYSLTQEQKQAFITIKSVFKLDHQGLENVFVNEHFVSFGVANGRASFIYSLSNQKPDFVNSPKENNDNIFVEKITNNWFYACKQS